MDHESSQTNRFDVDERNAAVDDGPTSSVESFIPAITPKESLEMGTCTEKDLHVSVAKIPGKEETRFSHLGARPKDKNPILHCIESKKPEDCKKNTLQKKKNCVVSWKEKSVIKQDDTSVSIKAKMSHKEDSKTIEVLDLSAIVSPKPEEGKSPERKSCSLPQKLELSDQDYSVSKANTLLEYSRSASEKKRLLDNITEPKREELPDKNKKEKSSTKKSFRSKKIILFKEDNLESKMEKYRIEEKGSKSKEQTVVIDQVSGLKCHSDPSEETLELNSKLSAIYIFTAQNHSLPSKKSFSKPRRKSKKKVYPAISFSSKSVSGDMTANSLISNVESTVIVPFSLEDCTSSSSVSQIDCTSSSSVSQIDCTASSSVWQIELFAIDHVSQVNSNASSPVSYLETLARNPISDIESTATSPISNAESSAEYSYVPMTQASCRSIAPYELNVLILYRIKDETTRFYQRFAEDIISLLCLQYKVSRKCFSGPWLKPNRYSSPEVLTVVVRAVTLYQKRLGGHFFELFNEELKSDVPVLETLCILFDYLLNTILTIIDKAEEQGDDVDIFTQVIHSFAVIIELLLFLVSEDDVTDTWFFPDAWRCIFEVAFMNDFELHGGIEAFHKWCNNIKCDADDLKTFVLEHIILYSGDPSNQGLHTSLSSSESTSLVPVIESTILIPKETDGSSLEGNIIESKKKNRYKSKCKWKSKKKKVKRKR